MHAEPLNRRIALTEFDIRPEEPSDIDAITEVTEKAFRHAPHTSHTEQYIVIALRRAGALGVSLVAHIESENPVIASAAVPAGAAAAEAAAEGETPAA